MRSDLDVVLDRPPTAVEYRPLPRVIQRLPHRSQLHYEELVSVVGGYFSELHKIGENALTKPISVIFTACILSLSLWNIHEAREKKMKK